MHIFNTAYRRLVQCGSNNFKFIILRDNCKDCTFIAYDACNTIILFSTAIMKFKFVSVYWMVIWSFLKPTKMTNSLRNCRSRINPLRNQKISSFFGFFIKLIIYYTLTVQPVSSIMSTYFFLSYSWLRLGEYSRSFLFLEWNNVINS